MKSIHETKHFQIECLLQFKLHLEQNWSKWEKY